MLNDAVTETIMDHITEQAQSSNPYITEAELAEKLQMSRTRLRETLQTLSSYGIIEKRQKRGVTLKPMTIESVRETYELRELLETYAMKHALEKVTADDIEQLEKFAEDIEKATQMGYQDIAIQNDLKFHNKIIEISGLQMTSRILDNLILLKRSFRMTVTPGEWHPIERDPYSHHDIIAALRKKDPECLTILRKHISWRKDRSLREIKEHISNNKAKNSKTEE